MLFCFRQDFFEMLLSDKDSQIALLEMSGVKTQHQVERLNRLIVDRYKINNRLKIEVNAIGGLESIFYIWFIVCIQFVEWKFRCPFVAMQTLERGARRAADQINWLQVTNIF